MAGALGLEPRLQGFGDPPNSRYLTPLLQPGAVPAQEGAPSMAVGAPKIAFRYFRLDGLQGITTGDQPSDIELFLFSVPVVKVQDERIIFAAVNAAGLFPLEHVISGDRRPRLSPGDGVRALNRPVAIIKFPRLTTAVCHQSGRHGWYPLAESNRSYLRPQRNALPLS
jgi:hypothetical protein